MVLLMLISRCRCLFSIFVFFFSKYSKYLYLYLFVYDSNVLSFSFLFCLNFTCRSGIEQVVSDADSDDDSAVVETIQPTDTIPPTEEGEFTPCSICLSLDTELRFDFDFIPIDVIPDAAVTVLPIEAGKTIIRCNTVDDFCRSGNCDAEICSSLADIGNQICGCNLLF